MDIDTNDVPTQNKDRMRTRREGDSLQAKERETKPADTLIWTSSLRTVRKYISVV